MNTLITVAILKGKVFTSVEKIDAKNNQSRYGGDEILFTVSEDEKYKLYHLQDCCENVVIKDICGELSDLVGVPILQATEATNETDKVSDGCECTWTFYRFATIKGSVVISWEGESNGYYSETVDFAKV